MSTGMVGLNGAPRPYLFTADTRLMQAVDDARVFYPHSAGAFQRHVIEWGCADAETAATHWMLWRHEYLRRPMYEILAHDVGLS